MKKTSQNNYTPYQLKFLVEIEKIIEIYDPVYTFCEVMNHIDLNKYLAVKERRLGRPGYDGVTLLRVILFAFMEFGYVSVRAIEKLCKTDIRFMWLLGELPAPSFMTIDNFMNNVLNENIDDIFNEINAYIFEQEHVDLNHIYIDGTKITANANRYSWVWKKSSVKSREKTFAKITALLGEMNQTVTFQGVKFGVRTGMQLNIWSKYLNNMQLLQIFIRKQLIEVADIEKQRNYGFMTSFRSTLKS